MINFFRRLRKQLLAKNNFSKYTLYAIGEIFLVVIGILIALQINNWNQQRIQNNLEISYLQSLQEEFEANLLEVQRVQKLNKRNLAAALELAEYTGPMLPELSETEFSKIALRVVFNEVQYNPGTGILNEIISSGKLSILSSKELKQALASLDGLLKKVRFQENQEHGDTRMQLIELLSAENISFRKMSFLAAGEVYGLKNSKFTESNLHLLQSKKFENHLSSFIYTAGFLGANYYAQLEEEIVSVIKIIQDQLN